MSRVLAVDTATEACTVALAVGGDIRERFEVAGREHTRRLVPMVNELLAEAGLTLAQIDAFACGIGPGSFAGVRIGVGFIKGAALALDRPVLPVCTLASLAAGAGGAQTVVAAIDARLEEVYAGVYETGGGLAAARQPECLCAPAELKAELPEAWIGVGSGWGSHRALLEQSLGKPAAVRADALPHAADTARLGLAMLQAGGRISGADLQPLYLRDRVALNLEEQALLRQRNA